MPRLPMTARNLLALACAGALAAALGQAPAASAQAAEPLTARADPSQLTGAWTRVVTPADVDRTASFREEPAGWQASRTGPYTLVVTQGAFSVRDQQGFPVAETTRIDSAGAFDVLSYIRPDVGAFCPQWIPQNATYTWAFDGADLMLAATDDRCADRSSILVGRWTRSSNVRTLLARRTSTKRTKKGESFTEHLTEGGGTVGSDAAVCSQVSHTAEDCRITLSLLDGTIVLHGRVSAGAAPIRLKVVSGTGAYRGAAGSASAKAMGAKKVQITLTLA